MGPGQQARHQVPLECRFAREKGGKTVNQALAPKAELPPLSGTQHSCPERPQESSDLHLLPAPSPLTPGRKTNSFSYNTAGLHSNLRGTVKHCLRQILAYSCIKQFSCKFLGKSACSWSIAWAAYTTIKSDRLEVASFLQMPFPGALTVPKFGGKEEKKCVNSTHKQKVLRTH